MKFFLSIAVFISFVSASMAQTAQFYNVTAVQFDSLIKNQRGILLDVRTLREFQNGHLENAGQLNFYDRGFAENLLLLPKEDNIYIYCNVGHRSSRAAHFLAQNGYNKVYNLRQGIMEWHRAGLPITVSPDARPDTDNLFSQEQFTALIASDELVFIDYYAPWCAPCRRMMPMIDSLKVEYHGKVNVVKINADASKELMKTLQVVSIPYLVLYRKGEMLFSHQGMISREELIAVFDRFIHK